MITPTDAEKVAIRAAAARRFPGLRPVVVTVADPIDAVLVVVALDLRAYLDDLDARSTLAAQQGLVVDRVLWASPASADAPTVDTLTATKDDPDPVRRVALERFEALYQLFAAVPMHLHDQLLVRAGAVAGPKTPAVPLTPATAPPGLSPVAAAALLADAPARGPGSLWSYSCANGLSVVLKAPLADVWLAAKAAGSAAANDGKQGQALGAQLPFLKESIVWSAEAIDAHLERLPLSALYLSAPYFAMGGQAAAASSSFL